MAGQLTIDTLKASSGVLATQNGMTGVAKAWVRYNGSTQTVLGSFNISSITYSSAGIYVLNFTTAMPNTNYAIAGTGGNWGISNAWIQANMGTATTSAVTVANVTAGGAAESTAFQAVVFSS